jgi:ubiquinone/menaquinone biosynthesis C-methylase UbiE
VDHSAEALAHLERRQNERGIVQNTPVLADASKLRPERVKADSAVITMVLHHADDPTGILRNVAQLVPPGALVVIGEFHPEGPCSGGPPRDHRLSPEKVREWCQQAGLSVMAHQRQTPEHYMVVAQRNP